MELIKKIKRAEAEAQEIVEKAKVDATLLAEKARQTRRQRQEEAELQRKKAIDAAVEKARVEAHAEVGTLKARAEQERRHLRDHVKGRVPAAVARVVDYLKGAGSEAQNSASARPREDAKDRVRNSRKG